MIAHAVALSEEQSRLLPLLGRVARQAGFYLGGGTAVALHLGHRRSVDFDWFTPDPLDDPLTLAVSLRLVGIALTNVQVAPGTLHATAARVGVSFFRHQHPLIGDLLSPEGHSFALASLDDLACMKLAAVAQRGSRKDFIDVYAIGARHRPLAEMLELYRRKYSLSDIGHLLIGLAYFDDAEGEPMPNMIWRVSWDEVKACISAWVKSVAG